MDLSPSLSLYTKDTLSARQAQRYAEFIAFGPIVFQAARLLVKFGVLDYLRDNPDGKTIPEVVEACSLSEYAAKVLLEAGLSIGLVIIDPDSDRFTLSKTGWFLLNDPATRVNLDFNHDVNYEGFFRLEESLLEGRPAGLEHFGGWSTIYEALSSLPKEVQDSWFAFDHFYSDSSFTQALDLVWGFRPRRILDVGGNTGRWALRCVEKDLSVKVTVMDLPQQLKLMRSALEGKTGAERISSYPVNLLDEKSVFPTDEHYDIIWMSQFLDCFSEAQVVSILKKAAAIMDKDSRLCIMETLWDRQRFEPAAFCLTMTSLYFTAMANGNSKMFNSTDLRRLAHEAGLVVEQITDNLGQGHSIIVCKIVS